MAIYRQGQASMDAQGYVTGYDTKWREQLTLIRPGATIFFLTQPLQAAVITEVISDTSIRAITTGGAVVQKTNYLILLHDSLTVDGLAQDVAETLRYYQSKETEIADALEFFRDFDLDGLKDLVNQVKQGAESAKQSAEAAKTSETAANTAKTQAEQSAQSADASKTAAAVSANAAAVSASTAKNEADRAAELAKQLDVTNLMRKDANLSDVVDVVQSKQNLSLDRFEQDSTETIVRCPDKNSYFSLKDRGVGWGVYDTDGWVALSVARGGTGALNAPEARKNLDVPGLNVSNTFVGSQLFKGSQDAVKIQRASDESSGGCWTVYLFADGQPGFRAGFYGPNYAIYSYRNNSGLIKRCMSLTPDGNVSFGGEISGNGFRITGNNGASFYNNGGGGNNLSLKADGTVELNSKGGVGYIDSKGSVISLINGSRAYRLHNVNSAAKDAAMRLWGSADRPTVIEWGVPDGYFYYVQQNKDGSRTMKMNGNIECTTLTQVSDRTLKDNIQKIEKATESLRKINGYTYTLKSNGMPYAGVIAQEVMEALPEAISGGFDYEELHGPSTDGDRVLGEERYLAVDYSALTGLLVQVCRESDERISKLESEIEELKAIVSSLNNNL